MRTPCPDLIDRIEPFIVAGLTDQACTIRSELGSAPSDNVYKRTPAQELRVDGDDHGQPSSPIEGL